MSSISTRKNYQLITPDPTGAGGLAINQNFVRLGDDIEALNAHAVSTNNPHSVTKSQVGLGNVSNSLQLIASQNLNDLPDKSAARSALQLGEMATRDVGDFILKNGDAMGGTLSLNGYDLTGISKISPAIETIDVDRAAVTNALSFAVAADYGYTVQITPIGFFCGGGSIDLEGGKLTTGGGQIICDYLDMRDQFTFTGPWFSGGIYGALEFHFEGSRAALIGHDANILRTIFWNDSASLGMFIYQSGGSFGRPENSLGIGGNPDNPDYGNALIVRNDQSVTITTDLRIPTSQPGSPVAGSIYFDGSAIRVFDGSSWI